MIYPIIAYGDPVLKKTAIKVEKDQTDVKKLAEDMFETMHNANGVGLAAPQIGMSIRLFVVDASPLEDEDLKDFKRVFVNPTMVEETGDEWPYEEGCLSIPGIRSDVMRPERVKLHYFDENWKEHTKIFTGMAARIIQHEYDHIEGVLFLDYLSPIKKRLMKAKLANISKGVVEVNYKMKFPLKK